MDLERIERALREGPVDEPIYVPGAFARRRRSIWSLAVVSAAVGAALVIGVIVGVGLSVLREPDGGVGVAPDVEALAAQLEGRWVSDEITHDEWVSALLAMGHDIDDIDAFLLHDPIETSTHYDLVFNDGLLTLFDTAPPDPRLEMGDGRYELLPDGRLYYDDRGCFITARFTIEGDRLTFDPISTDSCGADERVANSAFFNLAGYTRADDR
jgi:hypothetical protein